MPCNLYFVHVLSSQSKAHKLFLMIRLELIGNYRTKRKKERKTDRNKENITEEKKECEKRK